MKTCGYCGRQNEDSATVCRECGQSEFPETAEEKARKAQAVVEPEPEPPAPDVGPDAEASICPFCLFPNLPEREWCKQCGTPFNTSPIGPFESAIARGSMYRGIVRGRPKPIVLVTVWVSCLPLCVLGALSMLAGIVSGNLLAIPVGFFFAVISGSFLYQVTRNFITIPKIEFDE